MRLFDKGFGWQGIQPKLQMWALLWSMRMTKSTRRQIFPGQIFSKSKYLFVHFIVIHFHTLHHRLWQSMAGKMSFSISLDFFFTLKPRYGLKRYGLAVAGCMLLVQPRNTFKRGLKLQVGEPIDLTKITDVFNCWLVTDFILTFSSRIQRNWAVVFGKQLPRQPGAC